MKSKIYRYRISAIGKDGYYIAEKVTHTKKEAEKTKRMYLKEKMLIKLK
jgi:hypothetical protein